jgi:lipoate-protein ligase A
VVEAYRWLGLVWAATLRQFGLDARVVSVSEARAAVTPPPELAPAVRLACFGTLSPYEVVVAGRKVVGLAQVRRRNVLLQSGLHLRFDAVGLALLLAPDRAGSLAEELRLRATGLSELGLGSVSGADLRERFSAVLAELHRVSIVPGAWTAEELLQAGPES